MIGCLSIFLRKHYHKISQAIYTSLLTQSDKELSGELGGTTEDHAPLTRRGGKENRGA